MIQFPHRYTFPCRLRNSLLPWASLLTSSIWVTPTTQSRERTPLEHRQFVTPLPVLRLLSCGPTLEISSLLSLLLTQSRGKYPPCTTNTMLILTIKHYNACVSTVHRIQHPLICLIPVQSLHKRFTSAATRGSATQKRVLTATIQSCYYIVRCFSISMFLTFVFGQSRAM